MSVLAMTPALLLFACASSNIVASNPPAVVPADTVSDYPANVLDQAQLMFKIMHDKAPFSAEVVSSIRRAPQEGHSPRPLHDNAIRILAGHNAHVARRKPRQRSAAFSAVTR